MKYKFSKILVGLLVIFCSVVGGCSSSRMPGSGYVMPQPSPGQSKRVALLLPLSGPLAGSGQAVRNGFFAAYYNDKQNSPTSPTVTVYDTNHNNIMALYQQALNDGANFIVGPLTKPQLQTLANGGKLPVPTLALNTLDNGRPVPNLYQFGLSPRDEAQQVAEKARQDGHQRAIIIAPASEWGQGIAAAFAQRWTALGGTVVDQLAFAPRQDLSPAIAHLLQTTAPTKDNISEQRELLKTVSASSLRRQDFDVFFLVALPTQARLIKPLLKFYYAGNIPVYATSAIYSGKPTPRFDRDLDGIIFCDMPWVLMANSSQLPGGTGALQTRITQLWPKSYGNYSKLYALGIDGYRLTQGLNQASSPSGIPEATGTLYLGPQQQIYRRLMWAQMRNGVPAIL